MEVVENKSVVYEFGRFVIDPRERTLFENGKPVHLPAKEFDTLLLLVEHNGHALTKEEMISAIWPDSFVEESNLAKKISRLRRLLNTNGEEYIETLPKHGYRFKAELRRATVEEDEEPVIFARRTVKRVTLEVDGVGGQSQLALPPAPRRFFSTLRLTGVLIILVGLIFLAWYFRESLFGAPARVVDPYAPVRLTDDPNDDTAAGWTKDGRIRFTRVYSDNRSQQMIMNADGSGQIETKLNDDRRVISWSADEQRVFYLKSGDTTKVYLSNADGSNEVQVPRAGALSADGSMFAYHQRVSGDNFDIFTYSVATGEVRNITNSESFDADPSFSPDGKKLVFSSSRDGADEIYSINIDGTGLHRLTNSPSLEAHAAYSPDGTQILFGSDRENEDGDIYLMNADGSNVVKAIDLDKSTETTGPGAWSPDGTKLVFWTDRNGKDDVYVISAEVFKPRLVIADPKNDLSNPAYSPDGTRIVYSEQLDDKTGELKVLDLNTGRTNLVRKTEWPVTLARWAPDQTRILFYDRVDGNSEISTVEPDGTHFQNLTNNPSVDNNPSWSPNGSLILFTSSRSASHKMLQIFAMNADGSDPRQVTSGANWPGDPVWTSDASKVIFVCDLRDIPGNGLDVCQINLDGSGQTRLLSRRGHDKHPAVSPDGKRIVFTATSEGNGEIYVMNLDGTGLLRVTRNTGEDLTPSWSPDGKKVIFSSNRGGKFAIYEIEL